MVSMINIINICHYYTHSCNINDIIIVIIKFIILLSTRHTHHVMKFTRHSTAYFIFFFVQGVTLMAM